MDLVAETNRVNYERNYIRGVNPEARRFCIAFGHPESLVQQRHDNHLCYMCGKNVRTDGGLMHSGIAP